MADFGPWRPDLIPHGHDGLVTARNVFPAATGYKPIKQLSAVTVDDLGEAWRGGGAFKGLDGSSIVLAGANGGLYSYASSTWTVESAGAYTSPWFFALFGDIVIAVNGAAPLKYTISSGVGATLGGTPPSATMVAIVRDFVFMAGDSSAVSTVYWSAVNDAEGWTVGTSQSDIQPIPDGGPITALAGGEYGLVFQEKAIHQFSYVGTPAIFQRDKVSSEVGCIDPGAVAQYGRLAFFLSTRGFYAYADGELKPIGQNAIDQTFWSTYTRADVVGNIRCTVDPGRSLVIWAMPGRLWIYNWDLDRWTDAIINGLVGISTGVNAAVSLEDIDVLYPDGGSGNIDAVPYSLDDPIFRGGEELLTLVLDDNHIYSIGSSDNMAALLRMATQEIIPGRVTRVRTGRVIGDMADGTTLSIDHSRRLGDAQTRVSASTIRNSGDMPIRASGRYLQPEVVIAAGTDWSYIRGLELTAEMGGRV